MATDFKALKKNKGKNIQKLTEQLKEANNQGGYSDPHAGTYWQPTVDREGNGYAVIRFLPPTNGEELPFVRLFSHGFKGDTGKWYIENSRTTLGEADPVNLQAA